jgi:mono/diheme cytochrome c family protein
MFPIGCAFSAAILVGLSVGSAAGPASAQALGGATAGRELFRNKGCYECHGLAAQGAAGVGPALQPPRSNFSDFLAYVRRPAGQMPPYSARLLTASEAQAIYDHLRSLPKGRTAAEIPLLAPYVAIPPASRTTRLGSPSGG